MRIFYLHQYFTTYKGATGTRSYDFARYFVNRGHIVDMICGTFELSDLPNASGNLIHRMTIDGINVCILRLRYSNYLSYFHRMLAFVQFMLGATWLALHLPRPDVVFATSTPLTVAVPALIVSYLRRVPFVFEVRDLWPEIPIEMTALKSPILRALAYALADLAYKRSAKIIALSPGIARGIVQRGVSQSKVVVISNGSNIELFHRHKPPLTLMERLGLSSEQFVVGYFGAMGLSNGLDVVLDAAEILENADPGRYMFLLAGDGKMRPRLEHTAQQRKLGNVRFLGTLPRIEIPEYIALSDVCLVIFANFPLLSTNSPNKLFDALAAGKPVIVNKDGWMNDLVKTHRIGLSLPNCTGQELGEATMKLHEAPEMLQAMGRNARDLAVEQFDISKLAVRLELLLREIIGDSSESLEP